MGKSKDAWCCFSQDDMDKKSGMRVSKVTRRRMITTSLRGTKRTAWLSKGYLLVNKENEFDDVR